MARHATNAGSLPGNLGFTTTPKAGCLVAIALNATAITGLKNCCSNLGQALISTGQNVPDWKNLNPTSRGGRVLVMQLQPRVQKARYC